MNPTRISARIALGLAVSSLAFATPVAAQSPAESFHKAYYLEHESGDSLHGGADLLLGAALQRFEPLPFGSAEVLDLSLVDRVEKSTANAISVSR